METYSPFYRDSLSLQKNQAILCLPVKDNEKTSSWHSFHCRLRYERLGCPGLDVVWTQSVKLLTSSPSRPSSPISPNSPCEGTRHRVSIESHSGRGKMTNTGKALNLKNENKHRYLLSWESARALEGRERGNH